MPCWKGGFLATYGGGGEKPEVNSCDSHLGAINAFLKENPVLNRESLGRHHENNPPVEEQGNSCLPLGLSSSVRKNG